MREWSDELFRLSEIGLTQPHAAYSALTYGLLGRWTFLSRTIIISMPGISELFCPLEQSIRLRLLPALFGKCTFSDVERQLISLPSRLGGLGIFNPCVSSAFQFEALQRGPILCFYCFWSRIFNLQSAHLMHDLHQQLSASLQMAVKLAVEKGASSWLTAIPLDEYGFALHKSAFHDAVACVMVGFLCVHLLTVFVEHPSQ